MTNFQELGSSKNGRRVVYDPVSSHAATHFHDEPQLEQLVVEVLSSQELHGDNLLFDVDMGRIIGLTNGVKTDGSDEIVYAKRLNRDIYTSFTKSRPSQPSALLALAFEKLSVDVYELTSAWIGEASSPPFPGDPNETEESVPYWTAHALVWGSQEVQLDTVTHECPWLVK